MAISTQQFCSSWRKRIEAIDPCEADARQHLNTVYSELVGELRQIFESATFEHMAPPLDPQRGQKARDPDTPMPRLWRLITHYPAEAASNPVFSLLALAHSSLTNQGGREPDEEQLAPLAQASNLWALVHQQLPGRYHERLKLSYTAVLTPDQHPFYSKEKLIRDLYESTGEITSDKEALLADQTNSLFYDGCLQPIKETLSRANLAESPLPDGLEPALAKSVLNALLPVYFSCEQLLELSLQDAHAYAADDIDACFLDADPVADILLSMSKTKLVKSGVSARPFTLFPDEVYRRLAKHRNSTPQSEVAGCVHAPLDALEELAQSTSKEIIYPLASNPMTPVSVLNKLMNWNGWGAKTACGIIERNLAYINGETWQLMEMGRIVNGADQRKHAVLMAILRLLEAHQKIPDALRQLLNAAVFAAWRLDPSCLRLEMIKRGHACYELLMAAAWSWHWQERLAVARSPHAPEQALKKLSSDGLLFIRHAATQPRCQLVRHLVNQ